MSLFSSSLATKQLALDEAEKIAWLRLIRTDNIGPITFYNLIQTYGSAIKAIEAIPSLAKRGGRLKGLTVTEEFTVTREWESLKKRGGDFVFAADEFYPLTLAATEDAPPVLSILGDKQLLNKSTIGMVGARNASLNGRKFAEKIARDLGQAGQIIASGLARGIDTAAHAGSLATGTIAVVAGGIDIVYPPENEKLYHAIIEQGCIVAESPLGMEPIARHFPKRNRIISGLSSGVVVVEATLKSGSLITARMAGEQGRDVYAVPGHPFDPRAAGPNKLIRDGATLIQSADDVLENLSAFRSTLPTLQEARQDEWMPQVLNDQDAEAIRDIILQNMSSAPVTVDELVRTCQLTIPSVQMILLEMELAGRLQRLPGNRIVLIN